MARDDFPVRIRETIARRAGYICSNPDCQRSTVGPHSSPEKALITGKACHIHAASPGGPRYATTQTVEERKGIDNAIWLCAECSDVIDKDPQNYPSRKLIEWKKQHEMWVTGGLIPTPPSITISTSAGLAIPDTPGTITEEALRHLRQHHLTIQNHNRIELLNISATVQLPEPVIATPSIQRPAGTEIIWEPVRPQMEVAGGGTATRFVPPSPTGIYNLQIERLRLRNSIQITFITSNGPEARRYLLDADEIENEPEVLDYFLEGSFEFTTHGRSNTHNFFIPLKFDREKRTLAIVPNDDTSKRWKVRRMVFWS